MNSFQLGVTYLSINGAFRTLALFLTLSERTWIVAVIVTRPIIRRLWKYLLGINDKLSVFKLS